MNASAMFNQSQDDEDIEFDQLCDLCATMFDEDVDWKKDLYQVYHPHLDVYSLSRSAEANCHICN